MMVRWEGRQGLGGDAAQDAGEVVGDAGIGDAQDSDAAGEEDAVALGVVGGLLVVDPALGLDGQGGRVAVEVDDEAVDELLAAEAETVEAAGAEALP
jgi:hypothetical protein